MAIKITQKEEKDLINLPTNFETLQSICLLISSVHGQMGDIKMQDWDLVENKVKFFKKEILLSLFRKNHHNKKGKV